MTHPITGLPDFMADHILVAFHRGSSEEVYDAALEALTDEGWKTQGLLSERNDESDYPSRDVVVVHAIEQAEGVTSYSGVEVDSGIKKILGEPESDDRLHRPVLDLDMNAALIPSATPGHFHLYIDHLVHWNDYEKLLLALGACGIIEEGYMQASLDRGYSSARLPTKPKVVTP